MKHEYWVCHFAERHRDKLIVIPSDYAVHTDFTTFAPESEVRDAFARLRALYCEIFCGIQESPESYGVPLYSKAEHRNFSQQCRDSEQAAYCPFILLYNLFTCGSIDASSQSVIVPVEKYKAVKPRPTHSRSFSEKITNAHCLFKKLAECGFVFGGLKNNKAANEDIVISYPGDAKLLYLWKMLADKAKNTDSLLDFLQCSFRLLQDDVRTKGYDDWTGFIDTFPLEEEKQFIHEMDKALVSAGLLPGGTGYYYRTESMIKNKGPDSFRLININRWEPWHSEIRPEKLEVGLRIRNVHNCAEYLTACPESVKRIFTEKNDKGCAARAKCKHGVGYELDGQKYWRCACCNPAIRFDRPKTADIPHYIKLVELGEKK